MKGSVSLPFLLLFLFSCHQKEPKTVIPEEKFQMVYIALVEEGERYRTLSPDSSRHFSADSIFKAFNTSENEFRAAVAASEPKWWQRFFEGVTKKMEESQNPNAQKQG